jgi:hypothetical protein
LLTSEFPTEIPRSQKRNFQYTTTLATTNEMFINHNNLSFNI